MADFLTIRSKVDLQRLIDDGIQESLVLAYKASEALSKDNSRINELCKDVSAFANSAGGQIIYGIVEHNQKPTKIDAGINGSFITREWIEQILSTRIQPKISGLRINPIPLSTADEQTAYIITIPQATSRAPHQANDRYYRRYNFQSVAMADYEIREAMKRSVDPDLFLYFSDDRKQKLVLYDEHTGKLAAIEFPLRIGNLSTSPALYAIISIFVDKKLECDRYDSDHNKDKLDGRVGVTPINILRKKIMVPHHFPLFKELSFSAGTLQIRLTDDQVSDNRSYVIGYSIAAPGCQKSMLGELVVARRAYQLNLDDGQNSS